jgi:hypothetical protein
LYQWKQGYHCHHPISRVPCGLYVRTAVRETTTPLVTSICAKARVLESNITVPVTVLDRTEPCPGAARRSTLARTEDSKNEPTETPNPWSLSTLYRVDALLPDMYRGLAAPERGAPTRIVGRDPRGWGGGAKERKEP